MVGTSPFVQIRASKNNWFCYREQFKRAEGDRRELLYGHEAEGDRRELLYGHEAEGRYAMTRELTHLEARPEYWWWGRRMSTVV